MNAWLPFHQIPHNFWLRSDIHKFAVILVLCSTRHAILCAPRSSELSLVSVSVCVLAFYMTLPPSPFQGPRSTVTHI